MRFFSVLWNGEDYPSDLLCNCCQNKSITFWMIFLFNMNEFCISMHIYILVKMIWRGVQTTPSPCKVQTSLNLHYKYQKYDSEPPPPRNSNNCWTPPTSTNFLDLRMSLTVFNHYKSIWIINCLLGFYLRVYFTYQSPVLLKNGCKSIFKLYKLVISKKKKISVLVRYLFISYQWKDIFLNETFHNSKCNFFKENKLLHLSGIFFRKMPETRSLSFVWLSRSNYS